RMFAPDSFDYKRGEAQCLLNANQYAEAIALYDELIAENPDESEFWLLQANAYLALDLREETAANLEMARTLGDVTFQNLSLLASLYIQGGATDLGAEVAVSSLDFADSRDASALIRQIEHLSRSGNADQANVIASAFSLKLAPQLELDEGRRFASVRAMIDFRLGLEESGSQRLVSILEEDPLNGEALILLARHYSDKDEFEEAEFYFERALSVEDYQREALVALGQMEVRRGNFKEALDHLREAQELKFESNVQNFLDQVEEAWRSTRRS
ncbi:MAG: tetratricopeptide repeat protein, partial [Verrucomicrobiota bacterium]